MIELKFGNCRTVILIGNYAIKIPTTITAKRFLFGCYCNKSEREFWKIAKHNYFPGGSYMSGLNLIVTPCYYCSAFGLISLYKKAEPLSVDLTEEQKINFEDITTDLKKENFGIINNTIVCLDYH